MAVQSLQASGVRSAVPAMRQRLYVTHRLGVILGVEKKESTAILSIIAPHFGAILFADKGRRAIGDAQVVGRQTDKA